MIGFQALRTVDRLEAQGQAWELVTIPSQEKYAGHLPGTSICGGGFRQIGQGFQKLLVLFGLSRPHDAQRRAVRFTSRNDRLFDLSRILQNETPGRKCDFVHRSERAAKVYDLMDIFLGAKLAAELGAKAAHDVDIRARKAVDRMPVIPNRENPGIPMLRLQGTDKTCSILRYVLELIDKDMPEWALISPALDISGGAKNHVFEVDPRAQFMLILAVHWFKDR